MKKIIISQQHMRYLNEANSVNIAAQAKDNSLSSFSTIASNPNTISDIQKAKVAGDVNLIINGPKTNDSQPKQIVNVADGDTVQDAISKQANDDLIRNGGSVTVCGDGIGESYIFTKKTLEEARLAKIKKDGKVMTKKELTENILRKN
jgi:hypothetical protein